MTLEGTSGGVAGRTGDSHPAEQGSWKDDPLADPFPPSFDGASTWPDTSDERGEPALGSRGVTFADESPLPDLNRPPLPTSSERSEVLPQSRHGKNLRRALRCGLCTAVFCSLVGSVLLLEALLLATDSVSAGGSNVTLEYARKSLRSKMDNVVVTSACFLCLLMLAGHQLRRTSRVLRALHLPASVLGGFVGWVFFACVDLVAPPGTSLMEDWFSVGWDVLPGFCTNVVFCCLFLGTSVPRLADVLSSPRREHLIYGVLVVFGQYAVSAALTASYGTSLSPSFAAVMPYGYAGGPVVAYAMKDLFVDVGHYPDGFDLSLAAAILGMFVGVVAGAVLVNVAPLANSLHVVAPPHRPNSSSRADERGGAATPSGRRVGLLRRARASMTELVALAPESDHYAPHRRARLPAAEQTVSVESLDSLMFHICLVMLVMFCGYLLRVPIVLLELAFPAGSFLERSNLLSVLPLFLFCLIAGLALQSIVDSHFTDHRSGKSFIDRETIVRVSNTAQDLLITTAIARLGRSGLPPGVTGLGPFFSIIAETWVPFALVCAGGLVWGVLSFWLIAPRLLPDHWAERALVEFGVSIGATSTGLLLLRMADPNDTTPVLRDFTCKQIFHVLITGGGFFDVLVPIPLSASTQSALPLLVVSLLSIALFLLCHPAVQRACRRRLTRSPARRQLSAPSARRSPREVSLALEGQPRVTEGDMRAHGAALSLGAAASPQHDAEAGREDFSEVATRRCASAPIVASPPIPQGD